MVFISRNTPFVKSFMNTHYIQDVVLDLCGTHRGSGHRRGESDQLIHDDSPR